MSERFNVLIPKRAVPNLEALADGESWSKYLDRAFARVAAAIRKHPGGPFPYRVVNEGIVPLIRVPSTVRHVPVIATGIKVKAPPLYTGKHLVIYTVKARVRDRIRYIARSQGMETREYVSRLAEVATWSEKFKMPEMLREAIEERNRKPAND